MAFRSVSLCLDRDVDGEWDLGMIRLHEAGNIASKVSVLPFPAFAPGLPFCVSSTVILLLDRLPERMVSADNTLDSSIDDPNHFRFSPVAAAVVKAVFIETSFQNSHLNGIAVHCAAGASLRDEEISCKSIDRDKAEALGVAVIFSCIDLFFFVSVHNILVNFELSCQQAADHEQSRRPSDILAAHASLLRAK